jgi:hypothetical protein
MPDGPAPTTATSNIFIFTPKNIKVFSLL